MASGPELFDFLIYTAPPTEKPTGNYWGRSPPPLPMGFAMGGGRLDPQIGEFRPGGPIEQLKVATKIELLWRLVATEQPPKTVGNLGLRGPAPGSHGDTLHTRPDPQRPLCERLSGRRGNKGEKRGSFAQPRPEWLRLCLR